MPATIRARQPLAASTAYTSGDRFRDRDVSELMTPGVTCVSSDACLRDAEQAMLAAGVHAVLVVGADNGTPLGWVTSRGLLSLLGADRSTTSARAAITEPVTTIAPGAPARAAIEQLSQPGTTHLLVARAAHRWPLGVLSDVDLVRLAAI